MSDCEPERVSTCESKKHPKYSMCYSTDVNIPKNSCWVPVGELYDVRDTIRVLAKLDYKSFAISVDE